MYQRIIAIYNMYMIAYFHISSGPPILSDKSFNQATEKKSTDTILYLQLSRSICFTWRTTWTVTQLHRRKGLLINVKSGVDPYDLDQPYAMP
ncbi:5313_t:CDS:2 [Acaulospora morrowiae]|uniref:5313_t:CDS:1 n=1 Tax=Acaulospora morrowiae TaxID=94023 RepID=A0A9N8VZE4_9GLOM|nr:5313_t:CDS:2 [Acaulospora morrowiae]